MGALFRHLEAEHESQGMKPRGLWKKRMRNTGKKKARKSNQWTIVKKSSGFKTDSKKRSIPYEKRKKLLEEKTKAEEKV